MSANTQYLDPGRTKVSGAGRTVTHRIQPVTATLQRLWKRMLLARQRRAAINELSRLSDEQLKDIGVRRAQIPELVDGMFRRGTGSRQGSGSQES